MGSEGGVRRLFCHRCSKPCRICICGRFNLPPLDNSIAITILQHSLEMTHPLNSVRVAKLGFRNLNVVPVTDVNFKAQFIIYPLEQNINRTSSQLAENYSETPILEERVHFCPTHSGVSVQTDTTTSPSLACIQFQSEVVGSGLAKQHGEENLCVSSDPGQIDDYKRLSGDVVTTQFSNYTVSYTSRYILVTMGRTAKPDISWIANSPVGRATTSNGFMVKKLQRKKLLQGCECFRDFEEFKLIVPSGSVLLFPGRNAAELEEVDYEVKHLIVLDGTWAKARRMYYENPWLKLLPHLKLNSSRESLYSEVRHQPKGGCLSTIESIVFALKGLGDEIEGLDKLLKVFESMVGDQRRCKDEKFKAMT
ncbi:hypothetical protein HPP92_012396 [Vanilla planifolia]|uniref:tRNA-uridine aminocarboxypropyltransferase n=1 Tax=Vanilla planifolia TaxID=51239 RepID=A0A835V1P3_VANPL|nr:hypothetical protein HPP92_012396 [Vanilla planifolia]